MIQTMLVNQSKQGSNQDQISISLPWAWHSSAPACLHFFPGHVNMSSHWLKTKEIVKFYWYCFIQLANTCRKNTLRNKNKNFYIICSDNVDKKIMKLLFGMTINGTNWLQNILIFFWNPFPLLEAIRKCHKKCKR